MPWKKKLSGFVCGAAERKEMQRAGEKQKFPGNLPGTAVLGPLHDGGEKFLVPVFGEDKKGLINDLLCAGVRAALCQPEYCCQEPQFEGADVLRRGPEPGEVVVVGVAAAHGADGAVGGDAVLFRLDDVVHPAQCVFGSVRVGSQPETGGQHTVGVLGFRLVDGGAGQPHQRP